MTEGLELALLVVLTPIELTCLESVMSSSVKPLRRVMLSLRSRKDNYWLPPKFTHRDLLVSHIIIMLPQLSL